MFLLIKILVRFIINDIKTFYNGIIMIISEGVEVQK